MGTSEQPPKKFFKQKGQGMLEYALILSFVAAVFLIVFSDGGFGGSIMGTFDNATELLESASEENDFDGGSGGGSSSGGSFLGSLLGGGSTSSGVVHTLAEIASPSYKPLDWHEVNNDMKLTYDTITKTKEPNWAIASEYNLFKAVGNMVSDTREYHYSDEQKVTGWNDLMDQMGGQIAANGFTTSYKKESTGETLAISRNGNAITMKYSNGNDNKTFSIYADNQNKMHFESGNSTNMETVLTEYNSISANIYSGGWQFNK